MPRVCVSPRSVRCSRADRFGPWRRRRRLAPLVGVADAIHAAAAAAVAGVAAAAAAAANSREWQDKRLIWPCFVFSSRFER